jgi:hypothetical protein
VASGPNVDPASNRPAAFDDAKNRPAADDAKWSAIFKALNPIKICRLVSSEAPLYPSCVNQK